MGRKADLMAWSYAADPFAGLNRQVLDRFDAAGVRLWGASAFKGGDGPIVDLPNVEHRAKNMLAWAQEARHRRLEGVMATGWSRYSVCYVPCDTIEVALDCLVLAGATAWDGRLPRDYREQARAFLRKDRRAAAVSGHFDACVKATEAFSAWTREVAGTLSSLDGFAQLGGEPRRT